MTKRIVTVAGYHHRGADPGDLCAVQVVLQDENERVLDFRIWIVDENPNMSDEELWKQLQGYLDSLDKIDAISLVRSTLEYENELCTFCGELTQRIMIKKTLARALAGERE